MLVPVRTAISLRRELEKSLAKSTAALDCVGAIAMDQMLVACQVEPTSFVEIEYAITKCLGI